MNIITQAQLVGWLDELAQEQSLIAPRQVGTVLLYQAVDTSADIAWGFTRPKMSVKDAFFPPTERLLAIEKIGQQITLTETLPEEKMLIFGVRPCDARGMQILDALFIQNSPADPYYALRRKNATLIGLACQSMAPECFCTSVGGAPNDPTGLDILLTVVNGGYALQPLTQKGEAVLVRISLPEYTGQLPSPPRNEPFETASKETWPAHFNDDYWEHSSERCLSCRICAYVCPTCRCFSVRDEALPAPGQFERIRCWDSCAGENYRRIAGGHKPRAEKGERLRNRFMCKFFYYPEQYGLESAVACTGCGRCVDACPVNVDITEVLVEIGRQS